MQHYGVDATLVTGKTHAGCFQIEGNGAHVVRRTQRDSRVSLVAVGIRDKCEGALSKLRIDLRAVDVHIKDLAVCFTDSPKVFGISRALC